MTLICVSWCPISWKLVKVSGKYHQSFESSWKMHFSLKLCKLMLTIYILLGSLFHQTLDIQDVMKLWIFATRGHWSIFLLLVMVSFLMKETVCMHERLIWCHFCYQKPYIHFFLHPSRQKWKNIHALLLFSLFLFSLLFPFFLKGELHSSWQKCKFSQGYANTLTLPANRLDCSEP